MNNDLHETGQRTDSNYKATVIPTLRYRNGQSAIDWLCKAFGFKTQPVVPGN